MHFHDRLDPDRVRLDRQQRKLNAVQPQRVAERNQFARPLRRHDPRQPRHLQHISLGHPAIPHQRQRRRLQAEPAHSPAPSASVTSLPVTSTMRLAPLSSKCVRLAHRRTSRFVQFILKTFYESSARRLEGRGKVPQVFCGKCVVQLRWSSATGRARAPRSPRSAACCGS